MQSGIHTLSELFLQLGLPDSPEEIEAFIDQHSPLKPRVALEQADFWNEGQAEFLHDAIFEDSDWAELVDQLDARLRH